MGRMDGKVALVTGSTRGIGHAIATTFAAEGARVIVHGRREDEAKTVAESLPGAVGLGADMGDRDAVLDLVQRAIQAFGPINVLVNNAGIAGRAAVTRITDQDWDQVIAVNLTAPMIAIRAVVPGMKNETGGGSIVNLISGAATTGSAGFASYAASKGGLLGLSMTLAVELSRFNIRVNSISPSAMTDMNRALPPDLQQQMLDRGLATVESVADAALFLGSDMSRDITGEVLNVNGGLGVVNN
jgi:NAD(P)-dependent dehydrogenase (short-subunit alcohol dehydrogenase family)